MTPLRIKMSRHTKLAARQMFCRGWTIVEMLIVVALLAIVVGIANVAIGYSVRNADSTGTVARAKLLNEAIFRARDLDGDTNPAIQRSATNADEAIAYLINAGYVSK